MAYIKIDYRGTKEYYKNIGSYQLHREDGPAREFTNGAFRWYYDGVRHRKDGPSWERPNGLKVWYFNGKLRWPVL